MNAGLYKDYIKTARINPVAEYFRVSNENVMKYLLSTLLLCTASLTSAQIVNTVTMDTADYKVKGRITLEGCLDTYFAYNFNEPITKDQPYFVSMARHNEVNINLAFIDLKYTSARVRARIAPGFGTYMNANYSSEPQTLKHFVEANAGYKLGKKKNIWLDAGILGSPYTNESAISKDHLTYTRSFAAEYVPYYLSGLKLTLPLTHKVNTYLFITNGWQQITDQNTNKALGTQLEIRPSKHFLINWNTFAGKDQTAVDSVKGTRLFTDLFVIFNRNKLALTSCIYVGEHRSKDDDRVWWQANIIARYAFNTLLSVSGRFEYFQDKEGVVIAPITPSTEFSSFGSSLGFNITPDPNLLFRTEVRYLFSDASVYLKSELPTNQNLVITSSVCVWF
jgi:hypothetical protein